MLATIPATVSPEPIRRPTAVLTDRGHLGVAIGCVDDLIPDLNLTDVEMPRAA